MNKETKKLKQGLQEVYISNLDKEARKRWKEIQSTVKPIKDPYELNKRVIKSYENILPKTVVKKIKTNTYT